jgi:Amidase
MPTLADLADALAGDRTSRDLTEECLARIADPDGEGSRAFIKVHAEQARGAADFHDRLRRNGAAASRFAGIPVSIKDLFDIAGDVTAAGSIALRDAAPATRDAIAVGRLKAAGFVPIGRTNMTEFAFSGLGINPHYGTPLNVHDRRTGLRIPGGSSSGAAVSVTDGMAFAALGTDTGGSCRIPAALCGLVGFKPTAARVPLTGTVPPLLLARLDRAARRERGVLRSARCRPRRRGSSRSSRVLARWIASRSAADLGLRRHRLGGRPRLCVRAKQIEQRWRADCRHPAARALRAGARQQQRRVRSRTILRVSSAADRCQARTL